MIRPSKRSKSDRYDGICGPNWPERGQCIKIAQDNGLKVSHQSDKDAIPPDFAAEERAKHGSCSDYNNEDGLEVKHAIRSSSV